MIAKPTKQTVKSQGIQSSVSFGIKASGLHHILGILRNQLYSDKILAVIREYSCNAVDAHVEAGCPDRPIEVTIPNRMNPYFKVRDFGPALSDDDIQNVYAFYGESTKRNTNDQIGMLGIGSKAAFAYGDNYVINSFLNGKKSSYNAFIDPSQVGQISKLSEEDTKEEDGIEIVVPVTDEDTDEFIKKAKNLFEWFKVRPTIHGHKQFEYSDGKTLFSGKGWKWIECNKDRWERMGNAMVVMGNIGYPIDTNSLNVSYDDGYSSMLTDNLILEVEIGDLDISASREKLQYTDDTRKEIKKQLKRVQTEIADVVGQEFKGCKTLFEAKCLYGSVFRTDSNLYQLKDVIMKHLVWNGKVVDGSTFPTYNVSGVDLRQFKKSYRSNKYQPKEDNSISCEKNTVVIENDIGHRRGLMGRILPLIFNEDKKPFLIQFNATDPSGIHASRGEKRRTAKQVKAKWLKNEKFDGELIKLSSLPQHKLAEFGYTNAGGGNGSYATKNAKHSAKCFTYDFKTEVSRYDRKKSTYYKIASVDVKKESGVYVIIDQFELEDGGTLHSPYRLKEIAEGMKVLGMKIPKVYAFKVAQRDKIEGKEGWTNVWEYLKKALKDEIDTNCLAQKYTDRQHTKNFTQRQDTLRNVIGLIDGDKWGKDDEKTLADKNGAFITFIEKYREMRNDKEAKKLDAFWEFARLLGEAAEFTVGSSKNTMKPTHDLIALGKTVIEKYAMLEYTEHNAFTWNASKPFKDSLVNYINVIDVCNKKN